MCLKEGSVFVDVRIALSSCRWPYQPYQTFDEKPVAGKKLPKLTIKRIGNALKINSQSASGSN
jgi:type II restriction/modification system DNA methylase subunit YeeA